jgi:aarF domain-containing kinase
VPAPWVLLVSEGVIVESFEAGGSVSRYIANPGPINTAIVAVGVDLYLKMLLHEGFVHSDMHPGNILCSELSDGSPSIALLDCGLAEEVNSEVRPGHLLTCSVAALMAVACSML